MKKISIVLMVAVLAVGFVFAETTFTGSAELDFDYDLGSQDFDLTTASAVELNWAYNLDAGEGSAMGEGDIYAEIAGSFSFDFDDQEDEAGTTITVLNILEQGIDTANIHVGELVIGIMGANYADTFATAYYDDDDDDDLDDMLDFSAVDPDGITLAYGDFSGGFALNGNAKALADDLDVYFWGEVADYAVSEELAVSASAYANVVNAVASDSFNFGFAAKAAYTTDDVTADAAVDFMSAKNLEVAANAAVAGITFNAYMYTTDFANFLADVKASTTIEDFTVYAEIRDIWAPGVVTVGESATFGSLDQEASVSYDLANKTLSAAASETYTYTADTFEVYETVDLAMDIIKPFKITAVTPEVGISSDVIVNGATLSATWSGADFLATTVDPGAVNISCTIEF